MDIDTKSLSNYQCSLLYDAKKGYSSSIQNYLITNNKNTKFENIFVELNKDPYDINSLKNYLKKLSIKRGNYKELWPSLI